MVCTAPVPYGSERRLPLAGSDLRGIAWGPDNRQVAALMAAPGDVTRSALWVLDITTGQARQVRTVSTTPSSQPIALRWPAGSGQIVIAWVSDLGGSSAESRVLYVDPATGTQTRLVLSKGGDARLSSLDVDASGQYLIYVLGGRRTTPQTIWWYGGGKPVRLTQAYNQASRLPNDTEW